jgi:hypothetical protein
MLIKKWIKIYSIKLEDVFWSNYCVDIIAHDMW